MNLCFRGEEECFVPITTPTILFQINHETNTPHGHIFVVLAIMSVIQIRKRLSVIILGDRKRSNTDRISTRHGVILINASDLLERKKL